MPYDPTLQPVDAPAYDPSIQPYNPTNYDPTVGKKAKPAEPKSAALKKIAQAVKNYAEKILVYRALERDLELLKSEKLAMDRRRATLESLEDPTIDAWCADYTDDLAAGATVGTLEVPGDYRGTGWVNVAPGFGDRAAWSSKRHGQLQHSPPLSPAGFAWNSAMQAPVQKWRARWRYATVLTVHANGTVYLEFEDVRSKKIYDQRIDINPSAHYENVPVDYMDCDAAAFAVGDRALVQFVQPSGASSWDTPTVIGFADHPKPCRSLVFFDAGPATYDDDGNLVYYSLLECRIRHVSPLGASLKTVILNGLTFHSDGAAAANAAHAYLLAQDFTGPLDTERAIRVYRIDFTSEPPVVGPVGTWTLEPGYSLPQIAADSSFLYCSQRLIAGNLANERARWGVYSTDGALPGWQSSELECRIGTLAAYRRWVAMGKMDLSGDHRYTVEVYEVGENGIPASSWSASFSGESEKPGTMGVGDDSVYVALPGFRVRVYRRSNGEVLHTLDLSGNVAFSGSNAAIIGIVPFPGAVYVGFTIMDTITLRPLIACQRTVVRDDAGVLVSESLAYLDTYYPNSSGNWLPASLGG